MSLESTKQLPEVAAVHQQIERWRSTRAQRGPMPAPLWDSATALARVHGVYQISKALRVHYDALKKRVTDGEQPEVRGEFVELNTLHGRGDFGTTVLEFCRADGTKMVVRTPEPSGMDLLALAESFWRRA